MKSLEECLLALEDTRRRAGRRHTIVSIIKLVLAGLIAGNKSLNRICKWARSLSQTSREQLGFRKGIPCVATLSNCLRIIGAEALEKVFDVYVRDDLGGDVANVHIALDGKSLRASTQDTIPHVHVLELFVEINRGVINQGRMTNSENEITAA
ncbi:MAG: transposase family protein, partial [Puniceicoccales bacterium]|nr:transposase family protein [Puniceicoccales bacterium]